jgi:hypothetical protein
MKIELSRSPAAHIEAIGYEKTNTTEVLSIQVNGVVHNFSRVPKIVYDDLVKTLHHAEFLVKLIADEYKEI